MFLRSLRPFVASVEAVSGAISAVCLVKSTDFAFENSWLSDFGGFPVTSSSMTVKSKSVLHTKLVVLASIESVLSEK